jgi:hypothetical protein
MSASQDGGAPERGASKPPACYPARISIVPYSGEEQLPEIQELIDRDLSEPYSIFTHRFFLRRWPQLCFLAMEYSGEKDTDGNAKRACVGAVVGKLVGCLCRRHGVACTTLSVNFISLTLDKILTTRMCRRP